MYLTRYLWYGESSSSTIYHAWLALCYIFPVVGAVISDSYWGRFRTIWRFSVVYFIGTMLLMGSSIPTWFMESTGETRDIHRYFAIGGLVFIAAGSGGIKPCVSPFGADQFDRYAKRAKESYFKWFYLLINFGGLISAYVTPSLRNEFDCYSTISAQQAHAKNPLKDEEMSKAFDECHVAAYGLPSGLMFIAIVAFVLPQVRRHFGVTKTSYVIEPKKDGENVMFTFAKTLIKGNSNQYVRDSVYQVLKLGLVFLPLSVFWASFEQIGSVWTFQAEELSGEVNLGFFSFYILNDQVEVLNSVLVIMLIPIWNYIFAPILDKLFYNRQGEETKKRKPLHLMFMGLLFCGVATFLAMQLQNSIDAGLPVMGSSKILGMQNPVFIKLDKSLEAEGHEVDFKLGEYFEWEGEQLCIQSECVDIVKLDENEKPVNPIKFLYRDANKTLTVKHINNRLARQNHTSVFVPNDGETIDMKFEQFATRFSAQEFSDGARVSVKIVDQDTGAYELTRISESRTQNVWRIVPQYVVITLAEVLISVTALEFAYTQAPTSMKTLCTALWYATVALANVMNIVLTEAGRNSSRSGKLLISVAAVLISAVIFWFIAKRYEVLDSDDITIRFEGGFNNSDSTSLCDAEADKSTDVLTRGKGRSYVVDSATYENQALKKSEQSGSGSHIVNME